MTHCPDCCIEQMLAMRNEQHTHRNNKGRSSSRSSSRKGSSVERRKRSGSEDSDGSRDRKAGQGGATGSSSRHQRKSSHGSSTEKRRGSESSSKNIPPISQLTIRTSSSHGDAGSDCGSMGSSASEITYGTNGGRSHNSMANSGGSNEGPHHVTRMPFTDAYGDKGWYTGEVASVSGLPHGKGTLHYCDGRIRGGWWSNGMAGATQQQQQQKSGVGISSPGATPAPPPPMKQGGNTSSLQQQSYHHPQQQQQQQQQPQQWERRRPLLKTDMPWTDLIGESGLYTGETDDNGEPNGMGKMRYHDGSILEGEWCHGELQRRREGG